MQHLTRIAMLTALLCTGAAAAVLSFNGLRDLALAVHYAPHLAWLLPISIDGFLLASGLLILDQTMKKRSTRAGWAYTALGVVVSVLGNTLSLEGVPGANGVPVAVFFHAVPVIFLALSVEAALYTIRGSVVAKQGAEEIRAQAEADAAEAEAMALAEAEAKAAKEAAAAGRERLRTERANAPKGPLKTVRPAPFAINADQVLEFTGQGMSYQEAADALTKKHGRQVSKARVNRAMKAAGLVESKSAVPSTQVSAEEPSWV